MYHIFGISQLSGNGDNAATGINYNGRVCGWADAADQSRHAIVWSITQGLVDLGTSHPPAQTLGRREANAINDGGQVVGFSVHADGSSTGFRWTPMNPNGTLGLYEDLVNIPGTFVGSANGINRPGQIVGSSGGGAPGDALMWTDPVTANPLGTQTVPGGQAGYVTWGAAINDSGQIAVVNEDGNGEQVPTLWIPAAPNGTNGNLNPLGTLPGSPFGLVTAINNAGSVVGWCSKFASHGQRAFLWTPSAPNGSVGSMTNLGVLSGDDESEAKGINNAGAIVGSSGARAFLYTGGVMKDLNTLIPPNSGWKLLEAVAINERGWIVGNGLFNGQRRGFLLTPFRRYFWWWIVHPPFRRIAWLWMIWMGYILITPIGPLCVVCANPIDVFWVRVLGIVTLLLGIFGLWRSLSGPQIRE